jgi:uncharacterized protein YndB with AHSA1/START domain
MMNVVNTITIAGPAEAVFDLVTTAGFWPDWHPATRAVGGVTRRPYRLGDIVWEKGQVGQSEFLVMWKIVEHEPPTRIVLECQSPRARITYTFRHGDDGVEYSRSLEFDESGLQNVVPNPRALEEFMHQQSAQALEQLKALVETILQEERIGLA